MDIGVRLFYLLIFGEIKQTGSITKIHHELMRSSILFYYLEQNGYNVNFKDDT